MDQGKAPCSYELGTAAETRKHRQTPLYKQYLLVALGGSITEYLRAPLLMHFNSDFPKPSGKQCIMACAHQLDQGCFMTSSTWDSQFHKSKTSPTLWALFNPCIKTPSYCFQHWPIKRGQIRECNPLQAHQIHRNIWLHGPSPGNPHWEGYHINKACVIDHLA